MYLAFQLHYSLLGLWMGDLLALTITSTTLSIFILRTDWQDQVRKCHNRLEQTATPQLPYFRLLID